MKRLILLLFWPCILCYSQNLPTNEHGKIVYTEVIEMDSSYTADILFNSIKEWFAVESNKFNRSNSEKQTGAMILGVEKTRMEEIDQLFQVKNPIVLDDLNQKKLIGRSVLKYTGGNLGCLRIMYVEYDIIVQMKDFKYKYELTNFNYTHYNQANGKQFQVYGWSDEGDCKSKGSLEEFLKCDKCLNEVNKFYSYLDSDNKQLINNLKDYVLSNKVIDNW